MQCPLSLLPYFCIFQRAWHLSAYVDGRCPSCMSFPGLAPVSCFPHMTVVTYFPSLAPLACCPAFNSSCLYRVRHQLMQAGACYPASGTSCMLFHVWLWEGTLFPASDTSCMLVHVWLWVHCFPRLTLVQRIHYKFRMASDGLFLRAFYLIMR